MIRGERVILDADLAELYGIETRRLNEQGKRNMELFSPGLHVPALVGRVFPLEIAFWDSKIRMGRPSEASLHDEQIVGLIGAIRRLMAPPEPPKRRRIGFRTKEG